MQGGQTVGEELWQVSKLVRANSKDLSKIGEVFSTAVTSGHTRLGHGKDGQLSRASKAPKLASPKSPSTMRLGDRPRSKTQPQKIIVSYFRKFVKQTVQIQMVTSLS